MRLPILFAISSLALLAQSPCNLRNLTVFDQNLAEYLEERTITLQPGLNTVEWRSLIPQAIVRTLRVSPERATVVRQEIAYDGPEARGQKRPILRLTPRNDGAAGPQKVQVDYLAPGLNWKGDYSLTLPAAAPPRDMNVEGWVTIQNDTAADICAGAVDLVAGDVQLQGGATPYRQFQANAQIANVSAASAMDETGGSSISALDVFTRFRMGTDIAMNAGVLMNRFPLLARTKFAVEQRHIFENDHQTQTVGRGGFMLQPRGLEVRLVSRNTTPNPLPAGTVTIYSTEGGIPQVVGQDRIPLTPPGADFSLTQGRSNLLQGTRRVLDRHSIADPSTPRRERLTTTVAVTISNRGAAGSPVFVREEIEKYGAGDWNVTQSSHNHQKLGGRMLEFRLEVPGKSEVKIEYTVEIR
jgi:hypothetical protein